LRMGPAPGGAPAPDRPARTGTARADGFDTADYSAPRPESSGPFLPAVPPGRGPGAHGDHRWSVAMLNSAPALVDGTPSADLASTSSARPPLRASAAATRAGL